MWCGVRWGKGLQILENVRVIGEEYRYDCDISCVKEVMIHRDPQQKKLVKYFHAYFRQNYSNCKLHAYSIDNAFVSFCNQVYRESIGIPMGEMMLHT